MPDEEEYDRHRVNTEEEGHDTSHVDYTETHSQDTMRNFHGAEMIELGGVLAGGAQRTTDENEEDMSKMGLRMVSLQTVEGGIGLDEHSPHGNGY